MKTLFERLYAALAAGERAVLCVVLSASGSAPRGAGAKMAVFADGKTAGTIGGGAVERIVIEQAGELLRTGRSLCRSFELTPDQVRGIGMVCGGAVTVYSHVLTDAELPLVVALRGMSGRAENGWLVMRLRGTVRAELGTFDEQNGLRFLPDVEEAALRPLLRRYAACYEEGGVTWYAEPVSRAGRVYVFGGGHVGRALVPVLAGVGFRVTVFDARPDFAKKENYPQAEQVILGDYLDIGAKLRLGPEDYAVIMTPGHQADREVLLQVLRTPACYIGCIGSRAKVARTNEFLRENGVTEAELARIHAPIGLPILAQTPEEIAVSVAAELIEHRARRAKEAET